ncbi:hypothetical protein DACRYDRAFT_22931 [Dacryopinax primogenitus]|uniref:Zn(2)-C6 fungal-type domain-containing protein n=1 Tax=Dacryopinax primogenitus (strain DJM 731) TaxID=1858805 RepID=M5FU16_DACPD|nr:uncharacterized protein DACRYDRAFT_22931 [Dacryopinax primogenitus]EJU01171.1 hypothetical protein DACRYDRAFT_22931 [Dacryopinax primogenitus]
MYNVIIVPNGRTVSADDLDGVSTVRANLSNGLALLIEPHSRSCQACRKKRTYCIHEEGFACYTCRASGGCLYNSSQTVEPRRGNTSTPSKRQRPTSPAPRIPYKDYPRLLPNLLRTNTPARTQGEPSPRSPKKRRTDQPRGSSTSASKQKTSTRKSDVVEEPTLPSPDPLSDYDVEEPGAESDDVSIKSSSSTRHETLEAVRSLREVELPLPQLSARLSDTMAFISRAEPVWELTRSHIWPIRELSEWCNAEGRNLRVDVRQEATLAWETFQQGQIAMQDALEKAKKEARVLMDTIAKRL